jgi:hypothetical protein
MEKIHERLKKIFYWKNMLGEMKKVIENCHTNIINGSQKLSEPIEQYSSKVVPACHISSNLH